MLTKRWMGTCVMSIAIGATFGAGMDAQSASATKVTITGCLQGPVPVDEYSPSAAGATAADVTFRLTNVTAKPMPASGATFLVIGSEKQLTAHLGHQVQIVGATQSARAATAEPAVRVESVRMVSAKCPERR